MGNTLNKYGYSFQTKVLTSIITDREFLTQIIDIIEPSYFENRGLKWLVEKTLFYFKEYNELPTKDVFKIQLTQVQDEVLHSEIFNALKESLSHIGSSDLRAIKDECVDFCIEEAYVQSILKCADFIKEGKVDLIRPEIEATSKKGQIQTNFGLDYKNTIQYRYTEEAEPERVPTGFEVLDELTNGGLPKGCMGIIIAPSGIGKSWFLAKLGSNAVKLGKNVLHITLELKDTYTAKRYDSLLTNIPFDDLKYHVDQVEKVVSKLSGNVHVVEYPPSYLSLNMFEALLDKFRLAGIVIDEVIIDYPELMKIDFNGIRDDNVLKNLYTDLTGLAGRFNFSLWIVDQTNRESSSKDVIENNGISNAFSKVFIATLVLTLSRKIKDKMNNTARLLLSKSRLGQDGIVLPCKFDTYSPIIEIYHPKTEDGKKTKEDMKSDAEFEQEFMRDKWEKFKSKNNNLF